MDNIDLSTVRYIKLDKPTTFICGHCKKEKNSKKECSMYRQNPTAHTAYIYNSLSTDTISSLKLHRFIFYPHYTSASALAIIPSSFSTISAFSGWVIPFARISFTL